MDRCFVANQLVAAQAMKYGLISSQISCHGLPIRPAFNLPSKPKREIRQQLGMDSAASTVMLIGGGEGMGKLEEIAKALAQMSGFALQLLHFGTSLFEISLNELGSVP